MKTLLIPMNLYLFRELIRTNRHSGIKTEPEFFKFRTWFTKGHSWGVMIDDKLAFAIGFSLENYNRLNIAAVWMVPSPEFFKHKKTCFKALLAFKKWAIKIFDIGKFRAHIRIDNTKAKCLAEHLGFISTGEISYKNEIYSVVEVT